MKLKDFQKEMHKPIFSSAEAKRVGWKTDSKTLLLQLHQWAKAGELLRLKRGLYAFPEKMKDKMEVARALYSPAYVSLEYALHFYGLLPDVLFAVTLVTPKSTRHFETPVGQFIYHRIKPSLFWGYDPDTLLGEKEKVLVDYCYLHSARLVAKKDFWESMRWQNLNSIDFKKARTIAQRFESKKILGLVESLASFARTYGGA